MERDKLLSQVSRTIAEPRIKTPALVIMLGSTPAKAGLELSRHLLTLTPTDRRRVSLVYIDTDEKPGPQIEFYQEHAGELQVFDLHIAVPAGISYSTPLPPDRLEHTFIPPKVPQYFANGAGGIRNNGHIAAAYNHQRIVQTIESALGALERLGTDQNERQLSEMQVNIVAFLGGGTGSGILPDVAVMVREILLSRQYLQRINLFCMLPEHIRGATVNDVSWRKSNAAACLLELLALSHVAGVQQGSYTKWLLNNGYHLTDDPIANEVYLVGRTAMGNDEDSARIVGIDLFQRIADASGVGSLEHSTWVNRRTLGATDDKQLFTMFGTSCPLEVRFPAEETAAAFAQVSASYLLPLLIDFHPEIPAVEDGDRLRWRQDWTRVARFTDATADDKFAVPPQLEFGEDEFFQASLDSLDLLWDRLRRANHTIDEQIERAILMKRREEERKISATPPPASAGDLSPLSRRVRHLRMLEQEYAFVLDVLRANPVEDVPSRPRDAEAKLIQPFAIPLPQMVEGPAMRNQARKVCGEYNFILQAHRDATRYNKLLTLVTDLLRQAQAAAGEALAWLRDTGSGRGEEELRSTGLLSPAWQGRLDPPHPHLRHIFDLRSLRRVDGGNIAVERLYWWATASKTSATGEPFSYDQLVGFGKPLDIDKFAGYQKPFDFNSFAAPCIAYLSMHATTGRDVDLDGEASQLASQRAGGLADRVVEFFKEYYLGKLQDLNLFEMLGVCAVDRSKPEPPARQVSRALLEHLGHIKGLMRNLVAFEAELWHDGPLRLDTTVYLGMHIREQSGQSSILDATLNDLGALNERNDTPRVEHSFDPHRLQIAYGQHGISLATIPDFYKTSNSALADYLQHQAEWYRDGARQRGANKMPVHSSGELERLVYMPDTLFQGVSLAQQVTRRMFTLATNRYNPFDAHGNGASVGVGAPASTPAAAMNGVNAMNGMNGASYSQPGYRPASYGNGAYDANSYDAGGGYDPNDPTRFNPPHSGPTRINEA